MRIAYFDCFSGISGDMALGAFIDAGLDLGLLKGELAKLNADGYSIRADQVQKHGLTGTGFSVTVSGDQMHRSFSDIGKMIEESGLEALVKERSIGIFRRLAEAESRIHAVAVDEVRFHEIGALDSIIDIVGVSIAVQMLGIEKIYSSTVPLGAGFAKSMHGTIPVPAPATLELLKGKPVRSGGVEAELTTPTGAAVLAHLAEGFGPMPDMEIESIGYGAGRADLPVPNLLRIVIGESSVTAAAGETVCVLETGIDDMNPEFYGYLAERLFREGALDVSAVPMAMKKFRPAVLLIVIAPPEKRAVLEDIIFSETTTAGVRHYMAGRTVLPREAIEVATEYGSVMIKVIRHGDRATLSPEYEDCRRIAESLGVPLKEVYDAAKAAARSSLR